MGSLTLGVVSNSWAALLPHTSLAEQCRRALAAGYGYVEIRQRAGSETEERVAGDDRPWPVPGALAELARRFPALGFNLAVEAPFFTVRMDPECPYLERCAAACRALGRECTTLRLVDLSPAPTLLAGAALDPLAESCAGLALRLWRDGVGLALENSKQPMASLLDLLRRCVERLPEDVPPPRICWDPMNQRLQQLAAEDPVSTARALPIESLFEFHFKQGRDGHVDGDVGPGPALDWHALLAPLLERGYEGPALFEIPAGSDIWERLDRSHAYIRGLLA